MEKKAAEIKIKDKVRDDTKKSKRIESKITKFAENESRDREG